MTTVTGTLGGPVVGTTATGSVTFFVVDSQFRRVRNARRTDGTIVQDSRIDLTAGAYSTTLTPQVDIVFPEGSRTARQHGSSIAYLVVPESGSHDETAITVPDPTVALAPVALTSILARVDILVNTAALTLNFLQYVLVPNTVLTVPDTDQSVLVRAAGNVQPSASGGSALAIVAEGVTTLNVQPAIWWMVQPSGNNVMGVAPEFLLAPHSPGSYQLAVYGVSGTMIVAAKSSLTAYGV